MLTGDIILDLLLAALLAGGLVAVRRVLTQRTTDRRRRVEHREDQDVLKQLYHIGEKGSVPTLEGLSGSVPAPLDATAAVVERLAAQGLLVVRDRSIELTDKGRTAALGVVRSHRLWERYLADETGVDELRWHEEAEKREHDLTGEEANALARRLGHPMYDPHGDPIPQPGQAMPRPSGSALANAAPGETFIVVHVEDEPRKVYEEIIANGIMPGVRLRVRERTPVRVSVEIAGALIDFSNLVAANVTVTPAPLVRPSSAAPHTLADVRPGEQARVVELSPACRGMQRRRLLDLGLVPGTPVRAEFRSATGDPMAYSVRGALVALRSTEASLIMVDRPEMSA